MALLLLASGDLRPRVRARDQQADVAGLDLKRRVLDRLAALDPEPEAMEAALEQITAEIGGPSGPTRGVCGDILADRQAAEASPAFVEWLLARAVGEGRREDGRRGPALPG